MRINKYLAKSGIASRRAADKMIENGEVKINGRICSVGAEVSEGDNVTVNGKTVSTVKKYVESLERKGFIRTEPTKVITRDGRVHNGSLLYTIQPIRPIEDACFEQQIALAKARINTKKALEKYEKRKKGVG